MREPNSELGVKGSLGLRPGKILTFYNISQMEGIGGLKKLIGNKELAVTANKTSCGIIPDTVSSVPGQSDLPVPKGRGRTNPE